MRVFELKKHSTLCPMGQCATCAPSTSPSFLLCVSVCYLHTLHFSLLPPLCVSVLPAHPPLLPPSSSVCQCTTCTPSTSPSFLLCVSVYNVHHFSPPVLCVSLYNIYNSPSFLRVSMHHLFFHAQMFAYAAQDHCRQHGTRTEHFAKIASKNRRHGTQNPRASFQVQVFDC